MNPRDLLKTAADLVDSSDGKPRLSNLNRATSTVYYALFHTLARCAADMLIGTSSANRSDEAWKLVYRALNHGAAKNACKQNLTHLPKEIQDFANVFATMQEKRHDADYDPDTKTVKSAVQLDIKAAEAAIADFEKAPVKDRRAFAAMLLFKGRP